MQKDKLRTKVKNKDAKWSLWHFKMTPKQQKELQKLLKGVLKEAQTRQTKRSNEKDVGWVQST